MASVGPQLFVTRDFIESILSTILAGVLFIPLAVAGAGELDLVVLAGVVLGYLLTQVIYYFLAKDGVPRRALESLYRFLGRPGEHGAVRELEESHEWWSRNWDYDLLWARLKGEQRQELLLEQAYMHFYLAAAGYLFVYLIFNLLHLALGLVVNAVVWARPTFNILRVSTPIVGGNHIPTWLVVLLASVLFWAAYRARISKAEQLYGDEGLYVAWARNQHVQDGDLAAGVWGLVDSPDRPVVGLSVRLCGGDGEEIASSAVDVRGRFQMPGAYKSLVECGEATIECLGNVKTIRCAQKSIPEVKLQIREHGVEVSRLGKVLIWMMDVFTSEKSSGRGNQNCQRGDSPARGREG